MSRLINDNALTNHVRSAHQVQVVLLKESREDLLGESPADASFVGLPRLGGVAGVAPEEIVQQAVCTSSGADGSV